ncbi:unnamed protein product [Bemisia tabaci]|uniref:Uncharacterized protein n=1 Tax=Bemisia tabaci TaxID=7038 RepID=A0A9P0AH94_BEMTA|nr:unnamed protein product [Bemisia tabaci]
MGKVNSVELNVPDLEKIETDNLVVVPIHARKDLINDCCDLINSEWPRSKTASPTKVNSKLEMLGNVKSQMSSWLGGGIQLPSLRKTETEAAAEEAGAEAKQSAEAATDEKAIRDATGGADSDAHLSDLEGEEDKDGAFGGGVVGAKAVQGAKSIGSFLFSAVNKAGKTVSEASAKIKKTVEENVSVA